MVHLAREEGRAAGFTRCDPLYPKLPRGFLPKDLELRVFKLMSVNRKLL